ncbi:MAG: hypothetical protein MSC30_00730 [Gaiellaceae bacterium MAG52_C11]|nr:hypothetical protein [Candidatus Gaiellasilicea maunaloa]
MKKSLLIAIVAVATLGVAPGPATAAPCVVPSEKPLWIDYGAPQLEAVFGRPGVIVAGSGEGYPARMRATGATTIFWDMYLNRRVGTPSKPAEPSVLPQRANALLDFAVRTLGCDTPWIVMNELFGASTPTPWTRTTAGYRANVLQWARLLAARGAKPILLISSDPYTGVEAAPWWRELASVADIVVEKYFGAPSIHKAGPELGSRRMRTSMRRAASKLFSMNIPATKVGFMLAFQTGRATGGREGLEPESAWFEVAKLQALAARQVSRELGTAYVFSWGWGVFNEAGNDPDKAGAACVWLWARDAELCDAPNRYGFDSDLRAGQIDLLAGVRCALGAETVTTNEIGAVARVTGDAELALSILFARLVERRAAPIGVRDVLAAERAIVLSRFGGTRAPYLAALTGAGATLAVGRGTIGDELRRRIVAERLVDRRPLSAAQLAEFLVTYGATPAREVELVPAPSWLPSGRGVVLATELSPQVFSLATGREIALTTFDGAFRIRAIGETTPLAAVPSGRARPAIARALRAAASADAYRNWTWRRQHAALDQARCVRDRLPAVGAVELTSFLPFLSLGES